MIQINKSDLKNLANNHYKNLKNTLIRKLKRKHSPLYNFIKRELETIITAEPKDLNKLIIKKIPYKLRHKSQLKKIFNYDSFSKNYYGYGAYNLAKLLDIRVCPYCNRQYTFTVLIENGKTRAEFDHFFSQSKYPYLALSFYNLIPSCHICNSNLKGSENFSLSRNIHPYLEGYENEVRFKIHLRNKNKFKKSEIKNWFGINFFNGAHKSFDIKIKVIKPTVAIQKKANNNIDVFLLENLYNEHKDYVIELIQKAEVYQPEYVDWLFKEYGGKLFNSTNDVYRMLLSNYILPEDFGKRVLSKFTRDISEELGIIF